LAVAAAAWPWAGLILAAGAALVYTVYEMGLWARLEPRRRKQ
jgi:hypothetical protein